MGDGATAKRGVDEGDAGRPLPAEVTRLADELAESLRRTVEGCFDALLDEPARLADLAARLGGAGAIGAPGPAASAGDFAAVVEAIAIIDRRLGVLEERLHVLAEVTGTVARTLEEIRGDAGGGGGSTLDPAEEEAAGPAEP